MGLDMWFMARPKEPKAEEVSYWRKHNALHHWFEEYAIRHGIVENAGDFNCVEVPLTPELLDDLERDIREGNLEPTEGLFFGGTDYETWKTTSQQSPKLASASKKATKSSTPVGGSHVPVRNQVDSRGQEP